MNKIFRNGPVGALMDEYERAADELKTLLRTVSQKDFLTIADPETSDPDCRSIQTIMNHVVKAGYGYANYIRKQFGNDWVTRKNDYELNSPDIACDEFDKMLSYTLETLQDKWNITGEDVAKNLIKTTWGQTYDFEQLLEHAIVHVLRHRRQIERFLIKLK